MKEMDEAYLKYCIIVLEEIAALHSVPLAMTTGPGLCGCREIATLRFTPFAMTPWNRSCWPYLSCPCEEAIADEAISEIGSKLLEVGCWKGRESMINPYMEIAIQEARKAAEKGEVPVGAVIVKDRLIISRTHNLRETTGNATAHAEILAINEACRILGRWRLDDCDLYVTLEPCPMCAGAIINARIRRLYFGASDPKAGAVGSVVDLLRMRAFNHTPEIYEGIMESQCRELLTEFFRARR